MVFCAETIVNTEFHALLGVGSISQEVNEYEDRMDRWV